MRQPFLYSQCHMSHGPPGVDLHERVKPKTVAIAIDQAVEPSRTIVALIKLASLYSESELSPTLHNLFMDVSPEFFVQVREGPSEARAAVLISRAHLHMANIHTRPTGGELKCPNFELLVLPFRRGSCRSTFR